MPPSPIRRTTRKWESLRPDRRSTAAGPRAAVAFARVLVPLTMLPYCTGIETPPSGNRGGHEDPMKPRELTVRALILGALITTVFTAANVYLGLKVGLTFASSIPAAVISMAI